MDVDESAVLGQGPGNLVVGPVSSGSAPEERQRPKPVDGPDRRLHRHGPIDAFSGSVLPNPIMPLSDERVTEQGVIRLAEGGGQNHPMVPARQLPRNLYVSVGSLRRGRGTAGSVDRPGHP